MDSLIGRSLGPYQVLERLEHEGPYTAFRAVDTRLFNQPVMVTVFHAPPGDEAHRRFERVAEELVELRHPNILPVQDFGEQDGLVYFGSPFLEHCTLASYIGQGQPCRLEEALRLVALLGDALDHAHRLGLAHGGITPATIYLTNLPPGRDSLYAAWPLLGDFSIAAVADDASREHPLLVAYRPPEGAEADPPGADRYALAAVLVTMLTGAPPAGEPGRAPAVLPPGIGAVLQRALARAPRERFGSGAELVLALQEAVAIDERGSDAAAADLLAEARAAVTTGKFRMASQVYAAYLRLRPNDELVRREFATVESRRLERSRRRAPETLSAAPAVVAAPVDAESTPTPVTAGGAPALRPILDVPAGDVAGEGEDKRVGGRWNPFRRRPRAAAPAAGLAGTFAPDDAASAVAGAAGPPMTLRPLPTGLAPDRPNVAPNPVRVAERGAPALKPLVAPARERQRLVLPSAIGVAALVALLVLAGLALARRDGGGGAALTPAARGGGGSVVAGGASPSAPRNAVTTNRALATNVPAVIPVAPTPSPTPVPPTPTIPPLPPVYEGNFFDAGSGFPAQVEGQEGSGYQGGEYAIVVPQPDGFAIADLAGRTFDNLVIEVDARAVGPSAGGSYGLVFRKQFTGNSISQYFVLLDPAAGTVRLVSWIGTERKDLIPATPHPAIKKGEEKNRIVVTARGGQLTVLVNGAQVAQVDDPGGPANGTIGLRADAGTAPIQARFSNLIVRPAP